MNHTNVSSCFATTFLAFITPRHVTQVQRDRRWLHSETSWYQVEEEEKETKRVDLCIFFISVKRKQILWKMKPTRDEIGKEVTKWEREREREEKIKSYYSYPKAIHTVLLASCESSENNSFFFFWVTVQANIHKDAQNISLFLYSKIYRVFI